MYLSWLLPQKAEAEEETQSTSENTFHTNPHVHRMRRIHEPSTGLRSDVLATLKNAAWAKRPAPFGGNHEGAGTGLPESVSVQEVRRNKPLVASLLLVAMPGAPNSTKARSP